MSTTLAGVLGTVGVVGAALNLLLILALTRKLRDVTERLHRPAHDAESIAGRPVGDFTAVDLSGEPIDRTAFTAGRSMAVFLLPGCGSCGEIIHALGTSTDPTQPTVAFVMGTPDEPEHAAFIATLPDHVRVVALTDLADHPASAAFGVTIFPTIIWVRDGVMEMAAHRMTAANRAPAGVPG